MLNRQNIEKKLKLILSEKRFEHTINVEKVALKLAKRYSADTYKVTIAALLHDCAKEYDYEESLELCKKYNVRLDNETIQCTQIIHSYLGAKVAEVEFGIDDVDILNAIRFHTTGRDNMSLLEKIIWVADCIEPNRNFNKVDEIREVAFEDINKALLLALGNLINYLKSNNQIIHPLTKSAYEYLQTTI